MHSAIDRDAADGLRCRLYRESDLPGLLHLWESHSDWGPLTAETWNSWYRNTPFGDCIVIVAANQDDEIVGQIVFTPSVVRVGADNIRSLRMSAPILSRSMRRMALGASHPVPRMYAAGVSEGVAQGFGIVYAFPTHKWLSTWRAWKEADILMGSAFEREFDCVALYPGNPDERRDVNLSVQVTAIDDAADEHSALWGKACAQLPIVCGVDRSARWLRYNRGDGIALEARLDDGALVGYAVVRRNGLLADFFVAQKSMMPPVLREIVRWFARARATSSVDADSLKIMNTPEISSATSGLGSVPVDYNFAFVCVAVGRDVPGAAIDPGNWYLTPSG
jgi:hypothetical protein